MKWFSEEERRPSTKNKLIVVKREFGRWDVQIGGAQQTGDNLNYIWRCAIKFVLEQMPQVVSLQILILGFGAGGMVKNVYETFPHCAITAIEHDEEMIRLAKELYLCKPYPLPKIIEGDAADIVHSLEKKFDLILIDLFQGSRASLLLTDADFMRAIRAHLTQSGIVLINSFKNGEYLDEVKKTFPHSNIWTIRQNTMGAFW